MNIPDHISVGLETMFWGKILKFFDANPGPRWKKFGSRTWDKHPGSATLLKRKIQKTRFASLKYAGSGPGILTGRMDTGTCFAPAAETRLALPSPSGGTYWSIMVPVLEM